MNNLFDGLTAVVQYSRKDTGNWITMAAFDIKTVAENYAVSCSSDNNPWEYKVVEIISEEAGVNICKVPDACVVERANQ